MNCSHDDDELIILYYLIRLIEMKKKSEHTLQWRERILHSKHQHRNTNIFINTKMRWIAKVVQFQWRIPIYRA